MNETFVITKEWLNKHQTKNGGYTKIQIAVLGLCWPLTKNWQKLVIGKCISTNKKNEFQFFNVKPKSKPNKKQAREVLTIDNCIAYLFKNIDKISIKQAWDILNISKQKLDI